MIFSINIPNQHLIKLANGYNVYEEDFDTEEEAIEELKKRMLFQLKRPLAELRKREIYSVASIPEVDEIIIVT